MVRVKKERLGDYQAGAANNDIILWADSTKYSYEGVIDLIGSCKIRENYVLPSSIKIYESFNRLRDTPFIIEFTNQMGLPYLPNNTIYYYANYKIKNLETGKYISAELLLYRGDSQIIEIRLPAEDPDVGGKLYRPWLKTETFRFGISLTGSNLDGVSPNISLRIGKLGTSVLSELMIKKKIGNRIENLNPIITTIEDNTISFSYSDLPITYGVHEFVVGFSMPIVYGSVLYRIELTDTPNHADDITSVWSVWEFLVNWTDGWEGGGITVPNLMKIFTGEIDPYGMQNSLTLIEIQRLMLGCWAQRCGSRFHFLCLLASYALDHQPKIGKNIVEQFLNETTPYPENKVLKYIDDNFSGIDKNKKILLDSSLNEGQRELHEWYGKGWITLRDLFKPIVAGEAFILTPSHRMLFPKEIMQKLKEQGIVLPLYDDEKDGDYLHVGIDVED